MCTRTPPQSLVWVPLWNSQHDRAVFVCTATREGWPGSWSRTLLLVGRCERPCKRHSACEGKHQPELGGKGVRSQAQTPEESPRPKGTYWVPLYAFKSKGPKAGSPPAPWQDNWGQVTQCRIKSIGSSEFPHRCALIYAYTFSLSLLVCISLWKCDPFTDHQTG